MTEATGAVNITARLRPRRDPVAFWRLWRARRMVRHVERTTGWSQVKVDRHGQPVGEFRQG